MEIRPISGSNAPERAEGAHQIKKPVDTTSSLSSLKGQNGCIAKFFWKMVGLLKGCLRRIFCIKKKEVSTPKAEAPEIKMTPEQEKTWPDMEALLDISYGWKMMEALKDAKPGDAKVVRFLHIEGEKDQPSRTFRFRDSFEWSGDEKEWNALQKRDEQKVKSAYLQMKGQEGFETPTFYMLHYLVLKDEKGKPKPKLFEMEHKIDFAVLRDDGYEITSSQLELDAAGVPFKDPKDLEEHLFEYFVV